MVPSSTQTFTIQYREKDMVKFIMSIFRSGPQRVKAAYGMFTKAITELEGAVAACDHELGVIVEKTNKLNAAREETLQASANAVHAINNIKKLIGE
jgi:hypothetical protein